jgi:DNA polymerase IIIc chi subunit
MERAFNFYKLFENSLLVPAISTISGKIMETGEKTLTFFQTEEEMRRVDEKLWTFSQSEFMPHLTFDSDEIEEFKDEVPLLLTTRQENTIEAENLIILNPNSSFDFFAKFKKVFFLFSPEVEDELLKARNFWKEVSSKKDQFTCKFYEQGSDKKWQLKA